MALAELSILADFLHTGTQNAGTLYQPAAATGNGELDADEVAEIAYVEIVSPVSGGTPEDLDSIYLVIDGKSTQNLVNMSGRDDRATNPVRRHTLMNDSNTEFIFFGKNIVESLRDPVPALSNTTFKAGNKITIITKAGSSNVTADYRVRVWGYKYDSAMLQRFPSRTMPGNFTIRDTRTGRDISVPFPETEISINNWSLLPGGVDQDKPSINPVLRFATNSSATTANTPYEFRFDLQNVEDNNKDLRFGYDVENKLFVARGLGARSHANLRYIWFDLDGEERPADRFIVTENLNPIIFGKGTPEFPADLPLYLPIPQFSINDLIVYREKGVVKMQDNGTSIPTDGVTVALLGTEIDLGGKI